MKASIVIATYNSAPVIRTQLDALAAQHGLDEVELVVSDNGSTDDTRDIVTSYGDRFERTVVVDSSAVRGVSHARNAGAAAASGVDLLFLDHDDEVAEGWLEAMIAALAKDPFVAGRLEHGRLNPAWASSYRGLSQTDGLERADPPFLDYAFGGTLGIRRSLHEAVGGFDEDFSEGGEDCDYCYRLALSGTALTFVPGAIVHYRHRLEPAAILRQARGYGRESVKLLALYRRHGMGRPSVGRGIASWILILPRLPLEVWTRAGRARWLWRLGWRLGRLEASARWRVFSP